MYMAYRACFVGDNQPIAAMDKALAMLKVIAAGCEPDRLTASMVMSASSDIRAVAAWLIEVADHVER